MAPNPLTARKVLYVCHNHAAIRPGGVETYTLELFDAMRESGRFDPVLLARAKNPDAECRITASGLDAQQFFCHADHAGYDAFFGTPSDKSLITRDFDAFLRDQRPDVVHFQHTLFLGYDFIRQVRNALPGVPIVYTLHEFGPICHHNGQMVQTHDSAPCLSASPERCHACFPDVSPEAFFLRKKFIASQFDLVDLFVAPSRFLRDRYIDWGIPSEKIRYEEYGRRPQTVAPAAPRDTPRPRNRFAFFGQLTPFKGIDVLLRAAAQVRGEIELFVHGANLEFQTKEFQRAVAALLAETAPHTTMAGAYAQSSVPQLMSAVDWVVVPSIWWENSPLVIQEAFLHGRPVICSDIGGMAEKVSDDVNGLHFRAGDVDSLAATLRRAAATPGLWEQLSKGIPRIHEMPMHAAYLEREYDALIAAATGRH